MWRLWRSKNIEGEAPGATLDAVFPASTATYTGEKTTGTKITETVVESQLRNQTGPTLPPDDQEITAFPQIYEDEANIGIEKSPIEDSPYDSVRAAVRNTDGEEVANTVRSWILGMLFVTIASGINMLLSMR